MLDLANNDLRIVQGIIARTAPGVNVLVFGSRVKGGAKKFSDLDLALDAGSPIDWSVMGELKLALSESDLPIKVDVIDLNDVSAGFREMILRHAIPLPPAANPV